MDEWTWSPPWAWPPARWMTVVRAIARWLVRALTMEAEPKMLRARWLLSQLAPLISRRRRAEPSRIGRASV